MLARLHLVTDDAAGEHRTLIWDALLITFRDAGIGFAGGTWEQVDEVDMVTAGDERGAQRTSDEPCTTRHQHGAGAPDRSRCDAHGSRR